MDEMLLDISTWEQPEINWKDAIQNLIDKYNSGILLKSAVISIMPDDEVWLILGDKLVGKIINIGK